MMNHNIVIGCDEKEDFYLKLKDRLNNSICIGPTGSGKYSQLIRPMLNQDIMNNNLAIITIDTKEFMSRDVYNLSKYYNRKVIVFDPVLEGRTVKFNPLKGNNEVCKKILLDALNSEEKLIGYYSDFYDKFLDDSLYIIKKIYDDDANLLDFYYLISNYNDKGAMLIKDFLKNNIDTSTLKKDIEIANWFIAIYYKDLKEYSKSISLRTKIEKLLSNKFAKNSLVLERDYKNVLNIESIIKNKDVLSINTAYGQLRELGPFLANMLLSYLEIYLTASNLLDKKDYASLYIYEPQTLLIDNLASILDKESKINLLTMIGIQDIDVLLYQSSNLDIKNSILNKCYNNFIFPNVSKNTASYYLHLIEGSTEKEDICVDDIRYMKFGEMLFVQKLDKAYHEKLKIKYIPRFLDEYLSESFSEYIHE